MAPKHHHPSDQETPLTRNQQAVLTVLRGASKPMSAYQILDRTSAQGMRAPPQVYRALEKLLEFGLIHRIETLNAYMVCDHGPHSEEVAFAICDSCGNVSELEMRAVRPALKRSAADIGFSIHEAHVEIHGACGACLAKAS
jgi:Fur family zinc uptake transcriptional regulator